MTVRLLFKNIIIRCFYKCGPGKKFINKRQQKDKKKTKIFRKFKPRKVNKNKNFLYIVYTTKERGRGFYDNRHKRSVGVYRSIYIIE